jgi:hypothetical protein
MEALDWVSQWFNEYSQWENNWNHGPVRRYTPPNHLTIACQPPSALPKKRLLVFVSVSWGCVWERVTPSTFRVGQQLPSPLRLG